MSDKAKQVSVYIVAVIVGVAVFVIVKTALLNMFNGMRFLPNGVGVAVGIASSVLINKILAKMLGVTEFGK